MINLTIDNTPVQVEKGTTILKAARQAGIHIPTLCYYELEGMKLENRPGGCRVCVVEVEGRKGLMAACMTPCTEGMVVLTHSARALEARRTVVEELLSNHPADCLQCGKNGKCELQDLSAAMGIRKTYKETFTEGKTIGRLDISTALVREMDKCVACRRCETACNEFQSVGALQFKPNGLKTIVATVDGKALADTNCTYCGQCAMACPVGAILEHDDTQAVIDAINDPTKTVIVQTAPAVRVALGENFGMEAGEIVTGKMAAALRRLGFDYVFDTDFAADLTIMEEGTELLGRIGKVLGGDTSVKLPILTSCCPGWVNFYEHTFPDMLEYPSTAKSPQQMFGAIAKSYWAEKMGLKRTDIVSVSIMPCTAKKYECQRDEFKTDGNPDVDIVLTTRELARMIKLFNIDLRDLPEEDFDSPLGESTGAGVIFGATGGVIEAATRTAYELFTGKTLEKVDFTELRGLEGIRDAHVDFNGTDIHIGIAFGLASARKLIEKVRKGEEQFHAIEVMACPGGCAGGGGQPYHRGNSDIIRKRIAALYREDEGKPIRKSHENPDIKTLYAEYLGEPCGHLAHHLLHTTYTDKSNK